MGPRRILPLAFVVVCFGCAGIRFDGAFAPSDEDWVSYGGSDERSNYTRSDLAPPFREAWTYNAQGGVLATPLVRDNVLVVATLHGELQLVSLTSGKRLGYTSLGAPIRGTPILVGVNVIVPVVSDEGSLVYIGLREGRVFWKANAGPIESSPLLIEDQVVVSTLHGEILSIARSNGEQRWRYAPGNKDDRKPFRSSPVHVGENIVCGNDDGVLYAVRARDGTPVWSSSTSSPIFASSIVVGDNVIAANLSGIIRAVNGATGETVWERDVASPVYASPSSDGQKLFVATSAGEVIALDPETGDDLWRWKAESVINAAPLVSDGHLYVGTLEKRFYVLDPSTGTVEWKRDLDGRMKVPAVTWKDYLVLVYEDRTVEALQSAELQ